MKRNATKTNHSKPKLANNHPPLQEIPENLLATISGGGLIGEEEPLFDIVSGSVYR